jgi:Ca2+/Na+ antiporter
VLSLDVVVMLAMTAVAVVSMRTERTIRRGEGLLLLLGFVSFMVALVLRGT